MLPLTALLAACLPALALADVYSLSDLSWTLRNNNGSIVIPAKVPSQAHLDLLAAGIIEEPLLEQNGEFSFHSARAFECRGDGRRRVAEYYDRWIVNDSWTYTAELTPFTQAVPYSAQQKTLLVFYGLDTIANIVRRPSTFSTEFCILNSGQTVAGHPVAWVDNQFRQYVYDVTDLISSPSESDNNITVSFESAYLYGLNVTSITYENPLTSDVSTSFCHTSGPAERCAV